MIVLSVSFIVVLLRRLPNTEEIEILPGEIYSSSRLFSLCFFVFIYHPYFLIPYLTERIREKGVSLRALEILKQPQSKKRTKANKINQLLSYWLVVIFLFNLS